MGAGGAALSLGEPVTAGVVVAVVAVCVVWAIAVFAAPAVESCVGGDAVAPALEKASDATAIALMVRRRDTCMELLPGWRQDVRRHKGQPDVATTPR